MRYSYTFVNMFNQCRMKWYFRYRLEPELEEDYRPNNPLNLGILLEDIVKAGLEKAEHTYYMKYPIINDNHITEVMKAEHFAHQIKEFIPQGGEFEYHLQTDDFTGYIDYVVKLEDGTYAIYDFKYSNYPETYLDSMQVHLYKYYFEMLTGNKVSELAYILAPKIYLQQKDNETIIEYRNRVKDKLNTMSIDVHYVDFDIDKINEFDRIVYEIENASSLYTTRGDHCSYCEYSKICLKQDWDKR